MKKSVEFLAESGGDEYLSHIKAFDAVMEDVVKKAKAKFIKKLAEGYVGWDQKINKYHLIASVVNCIERISEHDDPQEIDAIVLTAFIHNMRE